MNVIFQDIRCFSSRHSIRLRPLTLVVGENSSGKSTFLGIVSAVSRGYSFPISPTFNEAPFLLGNYENIATYKGGKYGRANSFKIGYVDQTRRSGEMELVGSYVNDRGTPILKSISVKTKKAEFEVTRYSSKLSVQGNFSIKNKPNLVPVAFDITIDSDSNHATDAWMSIFFRHNSSQVKLNEEQREAFEHLSILNDIIFEGRPTVSAIAPLRTKPLRTYDQSKLEYSADGDHVPYALARLFDDAKTDQVASDKIKALIRFGKDSGLFKDLKVKFLGKNVSDPFQILVTVSGRPANLVDVGYGVSQSLPIVSEALAQNRNGYLLLQQPEVHLHPKAQAAIGSFFANLVATKKRRFIIETHSDYIVDRVRHAVAKKELSPDDVTILYLEPYSHKSIIHQMSLDENGNLQNAPMGYRAFFLREEMKMLTLGSDADAQ
ncbi:MAG: AAA family ATPase [Opitutaceae bacterium]